MQYTNLIWRNGQPYSENFDDIYYSSEEGENISGQREFDHVFFKNNDLPERWAESRDFVIAELGFGSGLNCLLTIREWLKFVAGDTQNKCLHYIAIEKYPLAPEAIIELIDRYPELKTYCDELVATYPPAIKGSHSRFLFDSRVVIHYKFMDVIEALEDERYDVDAWYLDGFSPLKNPDMWSRRLFEKIAQNSHNKTTCSTYTAAGSVRRNLQDAGFDVQKVRGYGRKREMLVATLDVEKRIPCKFVDKPWFLPPEMAEIPDTKATVIGSGIAGLCMAYSLVRRGWTVTLIDDYAGVAKATSSNPAAIVYPRLSVNNDVDTQFYTDAYCYALFVLNKLQDKCRKKFWFNNGLLHATDEKKITEIINKFQFNEDYVAIAEQIDDKLLRQIKIRDSGQVLVEYRNTGVVIPEILCDMLVRECGDKLEIVHADVDSIRFDSNRWQCYTRDELLHETEVLILAGGVRLNDLGLDINFPVEPVRGQVVVLEERQQSKQFTHAVNADVYFTPLIDGKHYLGATYSRDDCNERVDDNDNKLLLDGLNSLYPDVFDMGCVIGSWVGFRAMSKDRVPLVGAIPDLAYYKDQYADIRHGKKDKDYLPAEHMKGLYISAAHGSRGFTTSFLSAELIASQINGEPCPVSRAASNYLNPSRFVVNDLKRG